ncbi:MAG TPA: hypothetical protein VLA58_06110 [Chitinophagaceae bacterium]|nr:hypothetical protein [Chitinophagaceae bacterium]
MKKVIMAAVLLVSTVSVFAGETGNEKDKLSQNKEWKKQEVKDPVCTVSMEGAVTLPGISVKVTCSASAATCKEAITLAAKCLEEAKNILMY